MSDQEKPCVLRYAPDYRFQVIGKNEVRILISLKQSSEEKEVESEIKKKKQRQK
jgi:hypothetical protein